MKTTSRSYKTKKQATKKTGALPWYSRHKQLLLIACSALIFGGIGTYFVSHSNAATPGTPGATYKVWTWNIAGEKVNKGKTSTGITRTAANSIVSRDIQLAAFNEICKDQYNDIVKRLKSSKWNQASKFSYFASAIKTKSSCKGHGGGNAIFIKAGLSNASVTKLADDVVKERRNLLCATIGKTTDTFCTTHISIKNMKNGQPANTVQLNQVKDKLEQYYKSGRRVIIAGDFNAQPHYGRMNNWYSASLNTPNNKNNTGAYREVDDNDSDYCLGYGESTAGTIGEKTPCGSENKKIDMIFFRESQVASYSGDALAISKNCNNRACSDHNILTGTVTFK